jgi:hypothetical protein
VVENYRSAHGVCMASGQGGADTEDLRRAMTQYRELFQKLLGTGGLRRDENASQTANDGASQASVAGAVQSPQPLNDGRAGPDGSQQQSARAHSPHVEPPREQGADREAGSERNARSDDEAGRQPRHPA